MTSPPEVAHYIADHPTAGPTLFRHHRGSPRSRLLSCGDVPAELWDLIRHWIESHDGFPDWAQPFGGQS